MSGSSDLDCVCYKEWMLQSGNYKLWAHCGSIEDRPS